MPEILHSKKPLGIYCCQPIMDLLLLSKDLNPFKPNKRCVTLWPLGLVILEVGLVECWIVEEEQRQQTTEPRGGYQGGS
jgi:hypothetical protein